MHLYANFTVVSKNKYFKFNLRSETANDSPKQLNDIRNACPTAIIQNFNFTEFFSSIAYLTPLCCAEQCNLLLSDNNFI